VPTAYLVIAGDGDLRQELENQAKRLNVADHVVFLGNVPHNKVLELHNAADIFLTLQDLTNLGNQTMEAMHSGTCVIAYNIGGISDIMKDKDAGILLEKNDLPHLGEIIADLLLDDKKRYFYAQGSLKCAKKYIWTWDERIEVELREIYKLVSDYRKR
jgi:glycosyltransferase involved in cell wall biosynthesis